MSTYEQLCTYLKENQVLASTASLLGWDELTYMPPKGADGRSRQVSLIARMAHERFIAKQVGDWIADALASSPNDDQSANLREWQREYRRAVRVPPALVEEISATAVKSRQAWAEARAKSEFATFKPWLEKTIDLQRKYAACIVDHQPTTADEQYDALLDAYEPYETSANLRTIFAPLRQALVKIIGQVKGKSAPTDILHRKYAVDKQKSLAEEAARRLGFDFTAGRLDTTVHPFCTTISPGDVRITTRYEEDNFGNCFFSVIHETGHALYEQGLPADAWGTPLGEAVSLGVHESQSRFWENLVCRSEPFWRFYYPQAQKTFPESLGGVAIDNLLFAVNAAKPSLIRTEADESTYNLHIILRFEMEQALLWGDLAVADLPGAWNAKMKEYLGVDVPDDRHGCLQDVHWSQGGFGYFPTYTLGNLNAAALMDAARREVGDLDGMLSRGDFAPLLAWLREKVHRHGKRYPARELIRRATGHDLSINPLIAHLQRKVERYYA